MPRSPVESFSTWDFDAAAQVWRSRDDPENIVGSLEQITEGQFFQRGPNVYASADSAYVGRVAYVRGASLQLGSEGTVFLNNNIARADVNSAAGRAMIQRAEISVTIPGTGEEPATRRSGITSLTSFGSGLYTAVGGPARPNELEPIEGAPGAVGAQEPRRFDLPLGFGLFRRATAGEVINRSVTGWLARNAFDEIATRVAGVAGKNYVDRQNQLTDLIDSLGITVEVTPVQTIRLAGGAE